VCAQQREQARDAAGLLAAFGRRIKHGAQVAVAQALGATRRR
jgi:hypothetical protein